jgi:hypothetical protein
VERTDIGLELWSQFHARRASSFLRRFGRFRVFVIARLLHGSLIEPLWKVL